MDKEKTKRYYQQLSEKDLCDCLYCRNFYAKVKNSYPRISAFLNELGADIEKPLETWSVELEEGKLLYPESQYVLIGDKEDFKETDIEDVNVHITNTHPFTDIKEDHFVIELGPITLDFEGGKDAV